MLEQTKQSIAFSLMRILIATIIIIFGSFIYSVVKNFSFVSSFDCLKKLDNSSLEILEKAKNRIKAFASAVKNDEIAELKLTEAEINLIYMDQFFKNPAEINKKIQYINRIKDDKIIQERIVRPFKFAKNVCLRYKSSISFFNNGDCIKEIRREILVNGKKIPAEQQVNVEEELAKSVLIEAVVYPDKIHVKDYTDSTELDQLMEQTLAIKEVIKRLNSVEIHDGLLILKS